MKRISISIACYLVFALFIQNTCPMGRAGKSSIVPSCGHCPLVRHCLAALDGQIKIATAAPSVHYPLYLFTAADTGHVYQLEAVIRQEPLPALNHADTLPVELFKPPPS